MRSRAWQIIAGWPLGMLVLVSLLASLVDSAAAMDDVSVMPELDGSRVVVDAQTGLSYQIEVSMPDAPRPAQGYPVLVVLDGNARFPLLREARDTLTRKGPEGSALPLVIVSVGYPGAERFDSQRRRWDFTPPVPTDIAAHAAEAGEEGASAKGQESVQEGGADQFLHFLSAQLLPMLERDLTLDPERRALLGHSLGGLFALYAQQRCPECFRRLFAISPSLWWGQRYLVQALDARLQDAEWCEALEGTSLLVGVGAREQSPREGHVGSQRDRLRLRRAMVDEARDYQRRLQQRCVSLSSELMIFAGEDHGSVMWPAARQVVERLADHEQESRSGESLRDRGSS